MYSRVERTRFFFATVPCRIRAARILFFFFNKYAHVIFLYDAKLYNHIHNNRIKTILEQLAKSGSFFFHALALTLAAT